jgi:FkbM family methyltransferase
MKTYEYAPGKSFVVTDETVAITPYTFLQTNKLWEPRSIQYFYSLVEKKHGNKNATIVDVGAQSGLYTLYAKFLPDCSFYAFEPLEQTYALLLDNLRVNSIHNVKAYQVALGSKDEIKNLHVPSHLGLNTLGDTPLRFDSWKDIQVQVKCLDTFLPLDARIDYMKIDTEGWEYHVLKGAEQLIRKWKPELFLEMVDSNMKQCGVEQQQLLDYLHSLGYKLEKEMDGENFHFTPL